MDIIMPKINWFWTQEVILRWRSPYKATSVDKITQEGMG